jgi:phenylacetate-CoA ligase
MNEPMILGADISDIDTYVRLAADAQQFLRSRGLGQWVPAAHASYRDQLERQFAAGVVFKVVIDHSPVAFFVVTDQPSPWWAADGRRALYLSGIVVSRAMRGRSIGRQVIAWVKDRAIRLDVAAVRLDCHAENRWLCSYYEQAEFQEVGRVRQYGDYVGCLYEHPLRAGPGKSYHGSMISPSYEARRRLEQLDRAALAELQIRELNALLEQILPTNTFYAAKLQGCRWPIHSLAELATWPFTTKQELEPPPNHGRHAANLSFPIDSYVRFHRTSGTRGHPLVVLDTASDWQWWVDTWQFVLDAAGICSEDRVAMAFSFGPFIGFWSANDALTARGALVIPCGGMSSLQRVQLILDERVTAVCCTPSYALHLAEVAREHGLSLLRSAVRSIIVAGEPGGSLPAVRQRVAELWHAELIDHAGATEVGPWGYADASHTGLHIVESEFIAEFLRPGSTEPATAEELGELVLTTLGRVGAPLIRYRTGDLVRPGSPAAPGDNQFVRLQGGVLGRVDDMMIVRGVNVYPSAIEQILREFPEVQEFRLTVDRQGAMDSLAVEVEDTRHDAARIACALQVRLGLHVEVRDVPAGSLPRFEGKSHRFIDRRK